MTTAKEARRTIITVVFCIAVLLWGTIAVVRLVPDNNYHTPPVQTDEEKRMSIYKDCVNQTSGSQKDLDSTCRKLAGVN